MSKETIYRCDVCEQRFEIQDIPDMCHIKHNGLVFQIVINEIAIGKWGLPKLTVKGGKHMCKECQRKSHRKLLLTLCQLFKEKENGKLPDSLEEFLNNLGFSRDIKS